MFSFLREAPEKDGRPGPLSARRIAAVFCLILAAGTAAFALVIIFKAVAASQNPTAVDWKVFIPMFIPCVAFLASCIILLFFTTWEDIKGIVGAAAGLKKNGGKNE